MFWSLMPSTQVGESEFFHMATGGRSSCCKMLMGRSVYCHCFNKLHAAGRMTFVNLSGLVTWENLSKPHTRLPCSISTHKLIQTGTFVSHVTCNTWFVSSQNTQSFPKHPNIFGQGWMLKVKSSPGYFCVSAI